MGVDLTNGAIERICSDRFRFRFRYGDTEKFKPVLQIIDTDLITVGVCLSDGTYFNPAVLNGDLVIWERLKIGSIIKLNEFSVYEPMELDGKRIIIYEVEVIVEECDPIGVPILLPKSLYAGEELHLTQGAMMTMFSDNFSVVSGDEEQQFEPILQVIEITTTNFIHLSDGTHYEVGLLEGDFLLDMYQLHNGSVVKLIDYMITRINNNMHKIVYISDLDVIVNKCDRIGQPIPLPLPQELAAYLNSTLTLGAIEKILSPDFFCDFSSVDQEFKPFLQATEVSTNFIWMSDGFYSTIAFLSKDLAAQKLLQTGSVFKLTRFSVSLNLRHKVVTIFDLEFITDNFRLIG